MQSSKVVQARLRPVEESPLAEQAHAIAPSFDLLTVLAPSLERGAELFDV